MAGEPHPPQTRLAQSAPWLATLAVGVGFFLTRGPSLEDLDGANFLLALDHYDLALHRPHFPGYPVYVGIAASFSAAGVDGVLALQLPGLLGWGLGLGLFHAAVTRVLGPRPGWLAWALLALSPLGWLTAGRTGSDALGVGLALGAASALALGATAKDLRSSSRWIAGAGVMVGLSLGARPALAPWLLGVVGIAWYLPHPKRFALGLAVAICGWAAPFLALAGPDLITDGGTFLTGHFRHWGGAVTVPGAGSLAERGSRFIHHLGVYGLGAPLVGNEPARWGSATLWVLGLVVGLRALPRHLWVPLAAISLPFAGWLLLGQNPDKPRHLLPLVPVLATIAGAGLARVDRRAVAVGLLCGALVSLRTAVLHRSSPSPEAQLVEWLVQTRSPQRVLLMCGQSERLVHALAPGFRAEYVADTAERDRRLAHTGAPPELLWTDEIDGFRHPPPGYGPRRAVVRFSRDPSVDPHRPTLNVFTASPKFAQEW